MNLIFITIYFLIIQCATSDFIYEDFESTIGVDFNGAASTSSCDEGKRLAYQTKHGSADNNIETPPSTSEEDTNQAQFQEIVMEDTKPGFSLVTSETSILGHRENGADHFTQVAECGYV